MTNHQRRNTMLEAGQAREAVIPNLIGELDTLENQAEATTATAYRLESLAKKIRNGSAAPETGTDDSAIGKVPSQGIPARIARANQTLKGSSERSQKALAEIEEMLGV